MKEVNYEDWQKNPTPRMMWVWDNDEKYKMKRMVVYITDVNENEYPVIGANKDGGAANYKHCAEIEKQRRMTNQEFSWWLQDGIKDGKHREFKHEGCLMVYNSKDYLDSERNNPVIDDILIRENGGEWHEPLVEVEK